MAKPIAGQKIARLTAIAPIGNFFKPRSVEYLRAQRLINSGLEPSKAVSRIAGGP